MLVGYVSDEYHSAIHDVFVEIQGTDEPPVRYSTRSRASGSIHAEIPAGSYRVTLNREGFGAKTVTAELHPERPFLFRLLSDRLLGYMWPLWCRSGEDAEFRISSPVPCKLGLWRYGAKKELIRNLGWYDEHGPRALVQILPDGDFAATGMNWNKVGYGSAWHSQTLKAPDRHGLYYIHMKAEDGRFYSFPWIVTPQVPQSKIAVLASVSTWNAYNNFGGRSNYFSQDGLHSRPIVNSRQDLARYVTPDTWPYEETAAPLSFERPDPHNVSPEEIEIDSPIEGRYAAAMAAGEWRLLGWLEREGFDYDVYSDVDLHFGKLPLDQYQVLIFNTHPEYFSKEMYFQVKEWMYERGGRLMNLSGCALLAECDYPDERTQLCRREEIWEQRGTAENPATLLGVEYTHTGFNSGAPFEVKKAEHWAFAGTGLKNGDLFGVRNQVERCSGGASSLELDKITSNSPPNLVHLARGRNNNGQGGDTAFVELPGGGMTFSTGALGWTLSLWVDEPVSKITRNVLERMLR